MVGLSTERSNDGFALTVSLCTERSIDGCRGDDHPLYRQDFPWLDSLQKCLSMVVAVRPPPPPTIQKGLLVVGLFTERSIDGCSGDDHPSPSLQKGLRMVVVVTTSLSPLQKGLWMVVMVTTPPPLLYKKVYR